MDLSIPAQTLPQNSSITFTIEVINFLGIQSITPFDIHIVKAEDSPYQYKFGYFLSESDMQAYISGDKNLILGQTANQKSPKLTQIVPNSFLNQSILFQVSIIDQEGSVSNIYSKAEIKNYFNCTLINSENSANLKPEILFNQFIQALGQEGQDCIQLKERRLQQIYSKIDFSSQELNVLLKALRISKKYQSILQPEQRRVLEELSYQQCYYQENNSFSINYTLNENIDENSIVEQIKMQIKNFETALLFFTVQHDKIKSLLLSQTIDWDQKLNDQFDQIQACLQLLYLLPDNIILQFSKLSIIDEQIYNNSKTFLNLIQNLSLLIQDTVRINGDQVYMIGEMITWQLIRQTRSTLLELPVALQDQIISFSQEEQIQIKLNPFKFTNQTMESIKKSRNYNQKPIKKFSIDWHRNNTKQDRRLLQHKHQINLKMQQLINIISTKQLFHNVYLLQQNDSISQCSVEISQQENQTTINCKCQEFGYVFLAYFQESNNNTNESISIQQVFNSNSLIFSLNTESTIFYYLIGYIFVVNIILLLLIIYEIKSQQPDEDKVIIKEQDLNKLQIKSYPGIYKITKENFKYLHQLSQICYNFSLIKRSFYFIDINTQFCFMLLIIYLIDLELDKGQYKKASEIILATASGVIFRFLSKILQGFVRINTTLKIIIYILLEIILIIECQIISAFEIKTQNSEKSQEKFYNWLTSLAIYEILIEFLLISLTVYTYRLTFKSISFKEFKIINHLIYYFAYQEKLEKIFQQFVIL